IDLLYFLPYATKKGSKIYAEELIFKGIPRILMGSIHDRGSSKARLLKRFIEPNILGKLLGQIQAEGTKSDNYKIEFCNKNILELREFIGFLSSLGISKDSLSVKLDYHPSFSKELSKIKNDFRRQFKMKINYFSISKTAGKGYGFKIIFRNVVVSELIYSALIKMRQVIDTERWKGNLLPFCYGYLSKLLCGDGTFELTSKNRKKIQSRIKIYDGDVGYLKHYSIILKKFGFTPYIKEKRLFVRAMCNVNLAKKLLEIDAFNTNNNHNKIRYFLKVNEVPTKKC
ncbi:MAG TPA: hypothetical protein VJ438_05570, partial [Candidatus Nanoarchaeia archaeon]|nr:hypothetical protein [Candidatus Nanoarchaeia archaeon]